MADLKTPVTTALARGIVNRAAETHLPENAAWDAVNVDITSDGTLQTRRGYTTVRSGAYHSLFIPSAGDYALAVHDGQLVRIAATTALTETALESVVGSVRYASLGDTVYWSSRTTTGRVTATSAKRWGIPVPDPPSASATAGGGMAAGRYQVALTGQETDGEEGGAGAATEIDVTEGAGIQLSALSESSRGRRVYLSHPNGDRLFYHSTIPAGITTWTIGRAPLGRPLATQFCQPPPPADRLCALGGRLLLAVGAVLYWTRALYPALIRSHHQFLPFHDSITDLAPVALSGVYVGTAQAVWFLAGSDPANWSLTQVSTEGMVAGTALELPPSWNATVTSPSVAWWGTDGVWRVGMPDGSMAKPLDATVRTGRYTEGASALIHQNYFSQLISIGLH